MPVSKFLPSTLLVSCKLITKSSFRSYYIIKMTSNKTSQLSSLLTRLANAENQISVLSTEVKNIRKDLTKLTSFDSSDNFSEDECDEPVAKKLRSDFTMENDYVVVYTDGACSKNGRKGAKAGIGVWWEDNHPLNVSQPTVNRHTNNSAEIQACTEACKVAFKNGVQKLLIKTDSEFVIKCMTQWMKKWLKNNWKTAAGKDVINKEDLVELTKHTNKLVDVKYEHVRGHAGIRGNEGADKLAVRGAEMN